MCTSVRIYSHDQRQHRSYCPGLHRAAPVFEGSKALGAATANRSPTPRKQIPKGLGSAFAWRAIWGNVGETAKVSISSSALNTTHTTYSIEHKARKKGRSKTLEGWLRGKLSNVFWSRVGL